MRAQTQRRKTSNGISRVAENGEAKPEGCVKKKGRRSGRGGCNNHIVPLQADRLLAMKQPMCCAGWQLIRLAEGSKPPKSVRSVHLVRRGQITARPQGPKRSCHSLRALFSRILVMNSTWYGPNHCAPPRAKKVVHRASTCAPAHLFGGGGV